MNEHFNRPDIARQLIVFSGLMPTNCFTDIDGFTLYNNGDAYIIFEIKCSGVLPRVAQINALETLCRDLNQARPAILILAEHGFPTSEDVIAKDCTVKQMFMGKTWKYPTETVSLKNVIDAFIQNVKEKKNGNN